jgi:dihydroflavonol-4-reductase
VNPTVIIGPRDVRFHGGQIVRDIAHGRIPVYVEGGMNVVSVHDVVQGHVAALQRGRNGERYILGGFNMAFKEIFDTAAEVLGGRGPFTKVPIWSAKLAGNVFDLFGQITGRQPWITSELLASIGMNHWYSIEKAKRELAYVPSPIEPAFAETYAWYKKSGLL